MDITATEHIDRTRSAFNKRIKDLNKKRVSNEKEMNAVFAELVKVSREQALFRFVTALMGMYGRLVKKTPHKTGRARAAWMVGVESTEAVPKEGEYKQAIADGVEDFKKKMPKLMQADVIYISNNVEYILALEAGWAKYQSGGFIALFVEELKGELGKMIKA